MEKSSNTCFRCNPNGDLPGVDSTAYVDPSAQVKGNVHVGPEVYIGPNAVIRADEPDDNGDVKPVVIESGCNVQDGAIVHALVGTTSQADMRFRDYLMTRMEVYKQRSIRINIRKEIAV